MLIDKRYYDEAEAAGEQADADLRWALSRILQLQEAMAEAIQVIEYERLSEGSLDAEEALLAMLRAAQYDGTVR